MPTFVVDVDEEVNNVEAKVAFPDNVMTMHDELNLLPNHFKADLSFNQYMGQRKGKHDNQAR